MDQENQKWMASISRALEELKRRTEFMQSGGPAHTPPAAGSGHDGDEDHEG